MSENKNTNKIKILNFGIKSELPQFKINRNNKWINYGDDNLYPQYLLDVFNNRSNKHKAIINKKVDMEVGNGIDVTSQALKKVVQNKFSELNLEEISTRIAFDNEIMGGFSLLLRWNSDGSKIVAIDYIPFHKCRLSPDEDKILVSKDWANVRRQENAPTEYAIYNPLKAKEDKKQIYYFTNYTNGIDYYPLPYYSSTLNWIELDYEISNFHLNSVRNGFMPGFLLNFATGIPGVDEMDAAYKEFERKYTGSDNAGKFILTFSNGTEEAPNLEPIQMNDSDDRFLMLQKQVSEEIFVAHSVTNPQLFGIRVPGELGGKDELLESLAIFQSTYVSGKQKVIEDQLNKILLFTDAKDDKIIFKDYEINFDNIEKNNIEE